MTTLNSPTIPEERVRAIAYTLWLEEGRPNGRDEAHWFKANELVAAEIVPSTVPKKAASAPKKTPRRKPS
jgi:hypothetical protein